VPVRRGEAGGRVLSDHFRADGLPKRSFPSRTAAIKFMSSHGGGKVAYRCSDPECRSWHTATKRRTLQERE